ncbi:MAG TPA: BTAD domain-containing putative transcriptional regulator, partial [Anaerolineales bacterium]
MPHLSLYLLGSPHIEMDGSPVEADTRKAIALLVYLAISGESHTRDALATLLWPDYDQSNARAALRRTLSALRKGLRQEALEVRWDSIGLLPGLDHWSDVTEFRGLLAASAAHGHPPGEACGDCLPLLSKAVNLYRGDFMAGFTLRDSPNFDEWQFFEADELRRELAGALEKLARGDLQAGDFELAIAAARRWSSLDPLSEEAHRMLMQCYAGSGQRNAALRQYCECVRILEIELGVPPLEETTALYRSILEHGGVAAGREAAEARETAGRKAGTPEAEPDERSASPNIHRPGGLPLVGRARQMAA